MNKYVIKRDNKLDIVQNQIYFGNYLELHKN